MPPIIFRKEPTNIGIEFKDEHEYYLVLGYLAKHANKQIGDIYIYTHENQKSGARAYQGKLQCNISYSNMPNPLKVSFSKSGDNRLSVSDYVESLKNNGFILTGKNGDYTRYIYPPDNIQNILNLISPQYIYDFMNGYNL